MKRWALMNGRLVGNVVEQENSPDVAGTWVECTGIAVGPGCEWDGTAFTPPRLVPPAVSMRQAKLALLQAGKLAAVDAAINALTEPQRTEALINWTSATLIERNHPMVELIATAAGMSETDLDSLFSAAAAIV